ncbi:MAG: SdpI family protein [Chthoniobacterales bacterium]
MKSLILKNIGIAVLLIGISIPLIIQKIPMNNFYGIRFSQSFKSEKNWYEINKAGGKAFLGWSLPLLVWGITGVFLSGKLLTTYSRWSTTIMVVCVVAACIQSYLLARKIDKRNYPQPEIKAGSG